MSTALSSIKKIKNITFDDERKIPSSEGNHLHHRHSKSSNILPQFELFEETSNPAVFRDSDMVIIDAEMKASVTSDIELFPRKRKESKPSQYLSLRSQSVRNRYAPELCQTLSIPNHKNKNEIPSPRSGESWSEDNLLNTKPSNLSSLHIPIDRDDQRNTEDIPFNLSDLPCDSHTKHQLLEVRLQLQSQRDFLERGISQILRPESGQNKYSTDYLIKKPYYEHSFVDNFETFGFPKAHIVKGFKIMPNNRKFSGVPLEMNDYHSSKNRSNHCPSDSFTTTIQNFLTNPDDTKLEVDDKITERRTRTINQDLINLSNIMVPSIRCSEDDRSINIIVRPVKSCDESISDSSELGTDLSISTTRIPYCTSRTKFSHLDEKIDTKIPVVDEYFVSKSKINLHCQRTRGFRTASNKLFSLFTVSNNIIYGSTSTLDQRSVTVANKPKSVIQRFLHNQFFTPLHGTNIKQRILSKIGSHQNLSAGNDNMSNLISQIDVHNESSFNLTQVNDETSRFSTEETSNDSCNFLRESQSTSLITELRDLIENISKNNRNPIANLSSDEYIVAYYEDGPRVFRLEQIYSIGNLESIKTDPVIDFYAHDTDDSILSKNCGNVLANQVFDQDILNKVDSEVSAHYDGKNFSCVDPRPLRYNQLSKNHDYIVNIDGFSSESHENEIRCPKCAYFAQQSNSRYPLSPPSKEWELMYTHCFILSPILFPVYFLGGFDFLMSFLTNGKISQCNRIQKRWALWACIPSWIIAIFLIGVIIWWTYL
ncbi:hypothetical protein GcM1_237121 [Golovinomyces cichoracearum]|uniref:Uncharacterized protein n=1 Tax=Golovinomyces cichoracearum TaxID=62708 RepID=A0A420IK54_9PEZI|nr:hypothetical protein GcM1_237121 [Golovinomyces cichoracearum]